MTALQLRHVESSRFAYVATRCLDLSDRGNSLEEPALTIQAR